MSLDSLLSFAHILIPLGLALWFAIWMVTRWVVNVGPVQIAIAERRFIGSKLPTGRVFASGGEIGIQADFKAPGLHFVPWPIVRVVDKVDFVTIGPDELGVMTAADGESMPSGRIFAEDLAGELHDNFQNPAGFLLNGGIRGRQLRFLTNGTYKIHPHIFRVEKIKKTRVAEGMIGVITAADGSTLDQGQIIGRRVQGHDNFQKAEVFLKNGGQKGPQIDFLRPGTYNINTAMFQVEIREAVQIGENELGIVEARAGEPMGAGDVVAETPDMALHASFQDGQAYLDAGGKRGPQEAVLRPGAYYVNPYLFIVTRKPQTVIPQGQVGVLISNIGKDPASLEGADEEPGVGPMSMGARDPEESRIDRGVRQRHVVPQGYRGIQQQVLGPGVYPLNPLSYKVVPIPTTTRSVEWSADQHNRDFNPFEVVSNDGFTMKVEIRLQYRILPEHAPYLVQKLGSIEELEKNVIHPQIDGIFRAQVSKAPALNYQQNRAAEQSEAENVVRKDMAQYRVEVVSVMICNIVLPEALMHTTQERNLAEQKKAMYDAQRAAEQQRIALEQTKAEADQQVAMKKAEVGIQIAKNEATQAQERAKGEAAAVKTRAEAEAERIRKTGDAEAAVIQSKGNAQAEAYEKQVAALTSQGVTAVEVTKLLTAAGTKITPDILVQGGSGSGNDGLVSVLLANSLRGQMAPGQQP